jgi:hypothetical protein
MTLQPHLASGALKRKAAAMGMRVPRAPSIVDVFSRLPWLVYAVGSVELEVCHLVLAAAGALLAVIREDAQNDNTLATTQDGPAAVRPVGKWPRCGEPELPPHVGRSDSPAH